MNRKSDPENWMDTIVAQSGGKINREGLSEAVKKRDFGTLIANLSPEEREALNAALQDKSRLRALLQSEKAKAILEKIRGGKKDG